MASINAESEIGFASKLCKTRMCKFFEQGNCRKGNTCSFAHSLSDLQSRPNLQKTQLCLAFERSGTCRDGAACKYAHGEGELQASQKKDHFSIPAPTVQFVPVPVAMQVVVVNAFGSIGTAATPHQPAKVVGIQPVQVAGLVNIPPQKDECLLQSEREDDIWSVQTNDEDFDLDLESLPSRSSSRQTSAWSWISEADSSDQVVPESDSNSQCQLPLDSGSDASEDVHLPLKQQREIDVVPDLRLHKTKMCKFFIQGECTKGSKCKFAHESGTLKARPNLLRTSLCLAFQRSGRCKLGEACKYAHGIDQLRSAVQEDSGKKIAEHQRSVANSVERMFEEAPLASKQLTHEASGVVASYKNTFLHLRQKSPERRRRCSCY